MYELKTSIYPFQMAEDPLLAQSAGPASKGPNYGLEQDLTKSAKTPETWMYRLMVFLCLMSMCFGNGTAVLSSQLAGLKFRVFQLGSIIYLFVFIVAYIVILLKQYSLKIPVQDFCKLLVCAIIHVLNDQGFYVAASVSPVTDLDGLKAAIIVIMVSVYDFYKQRVSKYTVMAAVMAFMGVMLLSQPWSNVKLFSSSAEVMPCKAFGISDNDTTQLPFILNVSRNGTDQLMSLRSQSAYSLQNEVIGYAFIIYMTIGVTVREFLTKEVLSRYPVALAMFWSALTECLFYFAINVIYVQLTSSPYFELPGITYCFLFAFLFAVGCILGNIGSWYSYNYAYVTTVAFADVCLSVILYICQRTFLKTFFPGHANSLEILGVVLAIFSVLLIPFVNLLQEYNIIMQIMIIIEQVLTSVQRKY